MKPELPETVEIEPKDTARATVIWLHGLGADGNDFVPVIPLLGLESAGVRFTFPHAAPIPVTLNMGMVMRAWYDLNALDENARIDRPGLERSVNLIRSLIARERDRGIPMNRILLAGFSQGGSVALRVRGISISIGNSHQSQRTPRFARGNRNGISITILNNSPCINEASS